MKIQNPLEDTKFKRTLSAIIREGTELSKRINSPEAKVEAGDCLKRLKGAIKFIDTFFDPIKEKINDAIQKSKEALQETKDQNDRATAPAREVVKELKTALDAYHEREKERVRIKELKAQEKAQEQQKKQAKEEAKLLRKIGEPIAAREALEMPAPLPMFTEKPTPVPGVRFSGRWIAEVYNLKTLCGAVYRGDVPVDAILPNMVFLNGEAQNHKENFKIPGVVAKKVPMVASKSETPVQKRKGRK